jgi:hypothetical protein
MLRAQDSQISFLPYYKQQQLKPDVQCADSITIETLRFYISSVELLQNGKVVFKEQNSFHLLDAALPETMTLTLKPDTTVQYDQIKFNLGIDSITNTAGIMGGDLDPAKGMYWTWQSGYINMKIEGSSPKCKTRKNEFQFHLGGYLAPYNPLQTVTLSTPSEKNILINVDLSRFFDVIDLSKQNHIMSPGKEAMTLSEAAAKMFFIRK